VLFDSRFFAVDVDAFQVGAAFGILQAEWIELAVFQAVSRPWPVK
jgi:hypothetical protein